MTDPTKETIEGQEQEQADTVAGEEDLEGLPPMDLPPLLDDERLAQLPDEQREDLEALLAAARQQWLAGSDDEGKQEQGG